MKALIYIIALTSFSAHAGKLYFTRADINKLFEEVPGHVTSSKKVYWTKLELNVDVRCVYASKGVECTLTYDHFKRELSKNDIGRLQNMFQNTDQKFNFLTDSDHIIACGSLDYHDSENYKTQTCHFVN